MHLQRVALAPVILALVFGTACGPPTPTLPFQAAPAWPSIRLELVNNAFDKPIYVANAGDGSGRLFVVQKEGQIILVRNGSPAPTPFLDISSQVGSRRTEQGLLSVAFHPQYSTRGLFYIHYTDRRGDVVVARYRASADNPDVADQNNALRLLHVDKPESNHNGGQLAFGPDGYLYVGLGDGGAFGDPWDNAQNKSVLLGKLLRLDVDSGTPYVVPGDNPFVSEPRTRPEIWAYGLRNPWRFSFDRASDDLYIADPGQKSWEEVNFQRADADGGRNYGWRRMEGRHCYPPGDSCDSARFEQPVGEYPSSLGCAIIGGYVYRGPSSAALNGIYLFGDFCSGRIWGLQQRSPGVWDQHELLKTSLQISSFGEDEAGEMYLTSLSDNGLYRVTAEP
jgi:glucose/arabinose dehydrogenase